MRNLFLIFLIVFCNKGFASERISYILSENEKKVEIPFKKIENVRVSDKCFNHIDQCHALQVLHQPPLKIKLVFGKSSNLAQAYCQATGGVRLQLLSEDHSADSFCLFKDNTIIASWDLYNSHFPKKGKK